MRLHNAPPMSGLPSIDAEISEFRVEKARTSGTLLLSNGQEMYGSFFVAGSSATHAGREHVKDVLNAEPGFFPFELQRPGRSETVLYNRDHVLYVALSDRGEAQCDPGYHVATHRSVSMVLSNGKRISGIVRVYQPQGRDRLSDFARSSERFRYLESAEATYLVNTTHIVELLEEPSRP